MSRKPRAFRLDHPDVVTMTPDDTERRSGAIVVTEEPMDAIEAADGTPVPVRRRRAPWLGILLSAVGGLVTLALGLALEQLIAELFRIAPWLGALGLFLAAMAAAAFIGILVRELLGMARERRIEHLRQAAFDALSVKDHEAAKRVVADLGSLYRERRSLAGARRRLSDLDPEIIDADDRLAIAEREFLAPLDLQAKRVVANAAKQVSVVTAVSPRAIVDVAFVLFAAVRLLRQVSRIYGGPSRPVRLSTSCPRRLQPSRGHRRRRRRRQPRAAGARARPRGAHLGQTRRGRSQRPDDGPLRACRPGRVPSAPVHPRGAAEDRRRRW